MGILQFDNNENFDSVVQMLGRLNYLTLSTNGIISITPTQKKKLDEFGFFIFLVVIYWSFENTLKVLVNGDSLKRCILFFPDKSLYPQILFKTGEIVSKMPKGNTLLTEFDVAVFKKNLRIVHRKMKYPNQLKRWSGFYKLIKKDPRYLCMLGGKGLILDIDVSLANLLIDLPEDNTLTSKLFDIYITIVAAGYYSDTNLYCANVQKFNNPFTSFEIDSFLTKINCSKFSDVDCSGKIDRLIITETTVGGKLDNLQIEEHDFFSNKKMNGNKDFVNIDGFEYVSIKESNDTSFRNKTSSWLAFKNIGIIKYCYILLNLKSGLLNKEWLTKQTTAITTYCLSNTDSLEVVEMKCVEPQLYKNQLANKQLSSYKLKQPYIRLISDYKKVLKKYK